MASEEDLNPDQPATRADLANVRDQLTEHLTEAIRDSQTEVLRAFYGFVANTLQARMNSQDSANSGLRQRMDALEGRILTIEEKLHLPPDQGAST
jgi:glucan phosphorylase